MKSRVSWGWALLLAGCGGGGELPPAPTAGIAPPPDAPLAPADAASPADGAPAGYRPSTGERPGEVRYDEVGYAGPGGAAVVGAAHATLPIGSFAEVTALDSGKTVLVRVGGGWSGTSGRIIELAPAVAGTLGIDGRPATPVRVRAVKPLPADAAALAGGGAAVARADAPQPMLAALRRKLPPAPTAAVRPAPVRAAPVQAPRADMRGYLVQVAALSSAERAQAVATRLGGRVVPSGNLYRIQLGPFADAAAAERARGEAARQGFGDARVISSN